MTRHPGVLTKKLISLWVVTIASVGAIWGLARLDAIVPNDLVLIWDLNPVAVPRPEAFAAIFCVCALGILLLLANILLRIRDSDQTINLGSFLIVLGVVGGAGYFVYEVLSNEEATIPVVGQAEKLPAPISGFRLFNLNVLHGYPDFERQGARFSKTRDILQHFGADIVVLQEVPNTNEHGNMADYLDQSWNHVFARANGSRSLIGFEEGAAVISRFRLLSAKRMLLKPREPWWENRIALVTRLDIGRDNALKVVGVHLSNSTSADDQADGLLEILRGEAPDIIVGDFNSTPTSRAVQTMLKNGFVEAVPTKAIHGDQTFKLPNEKVAGPFIDHLFVSEGFLKKWEIIEAAWVLTSQPVTDDMVHARMAVSDHDGLLVTIHRR